MKEENKIVENTNVENGLLFNAEITYTKEICKKAYKLLCKNRKISQIIITLPPIFTNYR